MKSSCLVYCLLLHFIVLLQYFIGDPGDSREGSNFFFSGVIGARKFAHLVNFRTPAIPLGLRHKCSTELKGNTFENKLDGNRSNAVS